MSPTQFVIEPLDGSERYTLAMTNTYLMFFTYINYHLKLIFKYICLLIFYTIVICISERKHNLLTALY